MRWLLFWLLLMAILLPAADKRGKSDKPPDVTLVEFKARRQERLILIDGLIRVNDVTQPLSRLRAKFELLAPGDQLLSLQETVVSEEALEPGEEVPFYVQCKDHVRAVHIRVSVRSRERMYLDLENPGPYPIE